MEKIVIGFNWVLQNWSILLAAVNAILAAIIAIAVILPGKEPEETLYKIVGWIEKISRKKPEEPKV